MIAFKSKKTVVSLFALTLAATNLSPLKATFQQIEAEISYLRRIGKSEAFIEGIFGVRASGIPLTKEHVTTRFHTTVAAEKSGDLADYATHLETARAAGDDTLTLAKFLAASGKALPTVPGMEVATAARNAAIEGARTAGTSSIDAFIAATGATAPQAAVLAHVPGALVAATAAEGAAIGGMIHPLTGAALDPADINILRAHRAMEAIGVGRADAANVVAWAAANAPDRAAIVALVGLGVDCTVADNIAAYRAITAAHANAANIAAWVATPADRAAIVALVGLGVDCTVADNIAAYRAITAGAIVAPTDANVNAWAAVAVGADQVASRALLVWDLDTATHLPHYRTLIGNTIAAPTRDQVLAIEEVRTAVGVNAKLVALGRPTTNPNRNAIRAFVDQGIAAPTADNIRDWVDIPGNLTQVADRAAVITAAQAVLGL